MYEMIQNKPELHKKFESYYRDDLHSIWAIQELYRSGNSRGRFFHILKENMKPVNFGIFMNKKLTKWCIISIIIYST